MIVIENKTVLLNCIIEDSTILLSERAQDIIIKNTTFYNCNFLVADGVDVVLTGLIVDNMFGACKLNGGHFSLGSFANIVTACNVTATGDQWIGD